MRNFTTEDDDSMEAMNKDDIYRYFGHMQSEQIKHAQMKQKPGKEYLHRTRSILTIILRRSRMGTVWFYTSTSNKRAARPKLYLWPATLWGVHYTTSCNTQSSAPEDG